MCQVSSCISPFQWVLAILENNLANAWTNDLVKCLSVQLKKKVDHFASGITFISWCCGSDHSFYGPRQRARKGQGTEGEGTE